MNIEMLSLYATELAERMDQLACLPAEPGDTAVTYLEHRLEAVKLAELITAGLQFMVVPR